MKYKARLLRLARERQGMYRSELARAAGVSHTTVAHVEAGIGGLKSVRKMATALGIDVTDVVIVKPSRRRTA